MADRTILFLPDRPCLECGKGLGRVHPNRQRHPACVKVRAARCQREYMQDYARRDLDGYKRMEYDRHLRKTYGITADEYDRLLAEQDGRCVICGRTANEAEKSGRRLAVDHDHVTGRVRGLLCRPCNTSLGAMNDDPELLERAAAYLRSNRT